MELDESVVAPPVVAGHYRILALVGEGGMSMVYRAMDSNLNREVALKRLRPDRFTGPDSTQRLMHEARAVSRLSHPNIVPIFDAFEDEGTAWIVMELVDGTTLSDLLKKRGALSIEEILKHAEGLTSALAAAHGAGLLHRDVNPRNVMVNRDGQARLTDFGLACAYVPPGRVSQAATRSVISVFDGRIAGTPGYMSPEQILGRALDPRSDLFSLGLLLYEMCTGKAAFPATSGGDVNDALLHREPVAIARLNYEIPGELERIVRKAIAKRPDERYQSAADMMADVRHLRRAIESQDRASDDDRGRRRPLSVAYFAVSGIVLAGLVAVSAPYLVRWWEGPAEAIGPPPATPRQITSAPGWEARPALSPDGDLVAFASNQSGNPDIWIADSTGVGNPLRLTDDPAVDDSPTWFPDGSYLAFISKRGGHTSIWKVPRLGGTAMQLVEDAAEAAISPDGKRIAFTRMNAAGFWRIVVAPLNSPSDAVFLTTDEGGFWNHLHPSWSPDGREVVYQDFRNLWAVPASGGTPRRLTFEDGPDLAPFWSPTGPFVYFASNRAGTLAIWRLQLAGGKMLRMTMGTGPETQPSVSRDGSRLAYSTYYRSPDITLVDRVTGVRRRIGGVREESEPAFSPNGDSLLFISDRLGTDDLWLQPLARGAPEGSAIRLTDLPGLIARPGYSPDGKWISFFRNQQGQRDIYLMSASGGALAQLTDHPGTDMQPSWSPDGSKIAFASDRDGPMHIWVMSVSGGHPVGAPIRVTRGPDADMFPVWSPDGASIAFIRGSLADSEVWIVNAGDGAARRVTTGADAHHLAWDAASGAILVSGIWDTGRVEIRQLNPVSGELTPFDPPLVCGDKDAFGALAVSRDGRQIAYMFQEDRGDIWVLEAAPGSY